MRPAPVSGTTKDVVQGQVDWRTGPPIFPTAQDWFPATVIVDAAACTDYLVARARFLQ